MNLVEVVGGELSGAARELPLVAMRRVDVASGACYAVRWLARRDDVGL